tara:strand:+ start:216 stop:500 length:285 start_codon:yes stop_codon:yes gene_type:complete
METIESLKANAELARISEMKNLMMLIIENSSGAMSEDDFEIGNLTESSLTINVDEKHFSIGELMFDEWVEENFSSRLRMIDSKQITILGLVELI